MTVASDLEQLAAVFADARRLGFLGPPPVGEQVDHATVFAGVLEAAGIGPAAFLDLGSGGGLPGLVIAALWPEHRGTLLDASQKRTAFLRRTVVTLGWQSRVDVVEGRAEDLARDPGLRGRFSLVVARSFATPSVTAEIGGAFLLAEGRLAVSEPMTPCDSAGPKRSTEPEGRWPADGLGRLGLLPAVIRSGVGVRVAVIGRRSEVADRWPRGSGIPAKRPLW
jgi:16S rRNA (guanine527-N7)-methyltransferase